MLYALGLLSLMTLSFIGGLWCKSLPAHQDPFLHNGADWKPEGGFGGGVWHKGGVEWSQAPLPPKDHDCKAQTCRITRGLAHVDRCACGGERYGVWADWEKRNKRRWKMELDSGSSAS